MTYWVIALTVVCVNPTGTKYPCDMLMNSYYGDGDGAVYLTEQECLHQIDGSKRMTCIPQERK